MMDVLKAMVFLAVFSFCLGQITGCKKTEDTKETKNGEVEEMAVVNVPKVQKTEDAKETQNAENSVSGKYYNEDDSEEYIELKDDGMVFWRQKTDPGLYGASTEYSEEAREWKVYGNEIALIGSLSFDAWADMEGYSILKGVRR